MNTSHTFLKKAMTNSDHRTYKNTAYIRINMLYFYILYKRGHYYIIETLYSHFSWAMTVGFQLFGLIVAHEAQNQVGDLLGQLAR